MLLLWLQKQSPLQVMLDYIRENVQIMRLDYLNILYGSVTESYIFSLPTTLLFWTMSGKSPSDRGRWDISPAVAIPSVVTATLLSSRMGPLIAQYDND